MIIGVDARPLLQKQFTGTSEYTWHLLQALFQIDQENEYRLFANSYNHNDLSGLFSPPPAPLPTGQAGPPSQRGGINFPLAPLPVKQTDHTSQAGETKFPFVKLYHSHIPNKIFNLPLQKILQIPKIDKKLQCDIFFQPNLGFLALSKNAKSILTVHDLSFLRYPEFFSWRMRFWHFLADIKSQTKKARHIIAMSKNTQRDLVEILQIAPEKITVIHSGLAKDFQSLTQEQITTDETRVREKYNLPPKFFLALSTLEPRKNLTAAIKAFDEYCSRFQDSETWLVIAGGKGWKYSSIFREYNQARHKSRIKFVGYIKAEEKKFFYHLASAFLWLSHYEGFSFPPLEALAMQCPVVLSNNSSLPEVAGEEAILVNPQKIQEIVLALKFCQTNFWQNKMIDISQKILKKYTWENSAKNHLEIFQLLKNN